MSSSTQWTMNAVKEFTYEIVETSDLFDPANPELGRLPDGRECHGTRLVVMDETVEQIFGERIRAYFTKTNISVEYLTLQGGDDHKTFDQMLRVASRLTEIGTDRVGTPPIVIGGGVVQDVVGMAASLYRRGIPYVRVPTTLLGQIDGSVSAKTGVNYEGCRNRLGTFAPPPKTLIDSSLIATLPARQVRSGLGEALKMALIKDRKLFEVLEKYGDHLVEDRLQDTGTYDEDEGPGETVIHQAISGMAEELQKNLWETELRRIVDYGHTFSPIVEMSALPELYHGEAVAMDCVFSAILAARRGLLPMDELVRIVATVNRIGLAPSHPMFGHAPTMLDALADTMRHRDGHQFLTLLDSIGETEFVDDISEQEITEAARVMAALALDPYAPVAELCGTPCSAAPVPAAA
ncbi:sedoheptulose 7-phosphate cyclase [Streptomyces erythrochromogenes]|uniref:sedoheptulose 7-phosphate cyclase n=1 Tax=Streptomyces erythrochromogenes TaxID=285574 RepID=UPI0036A1BEBB